MVGRAVFRSGATGNTMIDVPTEIILIVHVAGGWGGRVADAR
jgi:hypothetical protein